MGDQGSPSHRSGAQPPRPRDEAVCPSCHAEDLSQLLPLGCCHTACPHQHSQGSQILSPTPRRGRIPGCGTFLLPQGCEPAEGACLHPSATCRRAQQPCLHSWFHPPVHSITRLGTGLERGGDHYGPVKGFPAMVPAAVGVCVGAEVGACIAAVVRGCVRPLG